MVHWNWWDCSPAIPTAWYKFPYWVPGRDDCIFQLKFENWYIDFLPDCIAFGLAAQGNMFPHFPVHQLLKAEFLPAHFEENPKKSMYLWPLSGLTFLAYKFPRSRHTWHGNTLDSLYLLAYRNKQKCAGINEFIIYFAK